MEQQIITYQQIKHNPEITALMERGNDMLGVLGYTEHSKKHACKVASGAGDILSALGHNKRVCELARIAGYMHDIGNCVNRVDHAHSGALLAFQILYTFPESCCKSGRMLHPADCGFRQSSDWL